MKEWLSGIIGENLASFLGFIIIFAIILGVVVLIARLIRNLGGGSVVHSPRTRQPRLSVVDAAAVDSRRKLVLIRRDDVEHLLLIGGPTDIVVEQNIVVEHRSEPPRIEPEHLDIFRQHEAGLAEPRQEPPALPPEPAKTEFRDDTIQLSSAIERPPYRAPEPAPEPVKAAGLVKEPEPATGSFTTAKPTAPAPSPSRVQAHPQPNYPPQPRTVLPQHPAPVQSPGPRAHPAYPLSQVAQGVVSATSSASAAASANPRNVIPQREPLFPGTSIGTEGIRDRSRDFTATREPAASPQGARIEPEMPVKTPSIDELQIDDDGLESLGGALHEAIMADLEAETKKTASASEEAPELDLFEEELLGSLDIRPGGDRSKSDPTASFEDEMERLLNDLNPDDRR